MQERNSSKSDRPVKGDGTQVKRSRDANWFGTSQEPQEEYIESTERVVGQEHGHEQGKMSEGEPTFTGRESHAGDKRKT